MRRVIMCAVMILSIKMAVGQNMEELLRQKETEKKYLIRQILAFKQYAGYLHKGYQVIKKGTDLINKIKQGDFKLHSDFFESLKAINPSIRNSSRVAEIFAYQLLIHKQAKSFLKSAMQNQELSKDEKMYAKRVYDNLMADCAAVLDELEQVITKGEFQMNDAERLNKIGQIY